MSGFEADFAEFVLEFFEELLDLEELLDEAKDRIEEKLIIEGEIENV